MDVERVVNGVGKFRWSLGKAPALHTTASSAGVF